MKPYNVLEIILHTKLDLEHHGRDIEAVRRHLPDTSFATSHGHRTISIATLTSETPQELMDRLRPVLGDRFKSAWVSTAPTDIVALHGEVDPRQSRIVDLYRRLRDDFNTKYVGQIKRGPVRFGRTIENGPSRAPVQVHRKARSKWSPSQDLDRPKR